MADVLVARFSAFGDTAMLVPIIISVAEKYPQHRFIVLTRTPFTSLFNGLAPNITTYPLDLSGQHKGIKGFFKVVKEFHRISYFVDEHDVLRTKFLRWAFVLLGKKVRHIDKGRAEKKRMVESKQTIPALQHTTDRYIDTFHRIGLGAEITFRNYYATGKPSFDILAESGIPSKEGKWIGIAPFAKHQGKTFPKDKMEKVIESLSRQPNTSIFLFGGGTKENEIFNNWQVAYPNTINTIGKLDLDKELLLISYMDVMLTMDSANMHLASLVGTPVISIWGATHPSIGFYGFRQDLNNAVQIDLDCRPCSVFGNKPCTNNEQYACMNRISEANVIDKINNLLNQKE